jgi:hypothetical protein
MPAGDSDKTTAQKFYNTFSSMHVPSLSMSSTISISDLPHAALLVVILAPACKKVASFSHGSLDAAISVYWCW